MKAALIVAAKEIRESLRDRRVLANVLVLGPLLTPLLFLTLVHLVVGREIEKAEHPLPLVIIGAQHAPGLVAALRQEGVEPLYPVEEPERAVRQHRLDLALRIAPDFAADWRAGRPAQVELIYDSSRTDVRSDLSRIQILLEGIGQRTGSLRLLARGIAPTLAQPIAVAERDQASPQARGAQVLIMLPYFLLLTLFMGGMWLAIDSTAGERERQSFEPLLINPVPRAQILLGKLLATALFSLASLVLGLLAFAVVGAHLPERDAVMGLSFGAALVVRVLLVMLPMVVLVAIAQIWVASFAKTFREAQTYLALVQLAGLLPSVLMMVLPAQISFWTGAVPLLGQQMIVMKILRGDAIDVPIAATGALVSLAAAAGLFALTLRLYKSERVAITA